jgi:hypothetical protein
VNHEVGSGNARKILLVVVQVLEQEKSLSHFRFKTDMQEDSANKTADKEGETADSELEAILEELIGNEEGEDNLKHEDEDRIGKVLVSLTICDPMRRLHLLEITDIGQRIEVRL